MWKQQQQQKKHLLRDFQENTLHSYNGYPVYRRRNNGFTCTKSNVELDDHSVVPHSLFLKSNIEVIVI